MKLNYKDLKDVQAWTAAGIELPPYDPETLSVQTQADPRWAHFGIGNIFRIFVGGIADRLLREGEMDRGITCIETFDFDVVDKIYAPYDNLALAVILKADGSVEKRVLGGLSEAIKARSADSGAWARMKAVFTHPGFQLASFTITEKGYALRDAGENTSATCAPIWRTARRRSSAPWALSHPCCMRAIRPESCPLRW